jgi:hypothetical protein
LRFVESSGEGTDEPPLTILHRRQLGISGEACHARRDRSLAGGGLYRDLRRREGRCGPGGRRGEGRLPGLRPDPADTVYGLAGYVQSNDIEHARRIASRIRAGQVSINYPEWDTHAPFGGYKQSGNGREYADWGIHDFLEVKGIVGYGE